MMRVCRTAIRGRRGRPCSDTTSMKSAALSLVLLVPMLAVAAPARPTPFVVEQTYWVKPGKEREFATLYARTGLPRLQSLQRDGRILWFRTTMPRFADGNDQWDCRVTIGWRDADDATSYPDLTPLPSATSAPASGPSFEQQMLGELLVDRRETPILETGYASGD